MIQKGIEIIKKLQKAGYTAYFVGGMVRDKILNREIKDIDIATSATPQEVQNIIPNTKYVGTSFGVLTVLDKNHKIQIATFRKEGKYRDGRRPESVSFTTDEQEDIKRRDLTINGIFWDPIKDTYKDYVGGQNDIHDKIIRFIGNPTEKIKEDSLRILRAIRIKNQLQFSYEKSTLIALKENVNLIKKLSIERINEELIRMFSIPNTIEVLKDLEEIGVLRILFPELLTLKGVEQPKQYHGEGDVWTHTFMALSNLESQDNYIIRLATVFHDIGKLETKGINKKGNICFYGHAQVGAKKTKSILKRLGFNKKDTDSICTLIDKHMILYDFRHMKQRRKYYWFSQPYFQDLLRVVRADHLGRISDDRGEWEKIYKEYIHFKEENQFHIPLVTGDELIKKLSLKEGKIIGEILKAIHDAYLEEKIHTKEEAFKLAEKLLRS